MKVDILFGRIFLAVLSCIAVLILVECASRFLLPDSKLADRKDLGSSTDVYRHPKPYVAFGGVAGGTYKNDEKLNANGYRGKAPAKEKIKGEYRIFVLGGSTVFLGEPPLPVLLEELFIKKGHKNISVFNYGVLSSVSGMELSRIIFEIADFKPDLIVMYGGGNDIGGPAYYDPRPGYPYNFMIYENNPILESDLKKYPTLLMTAYGSNLLRRFFPDFFINNLLPLDILRKDAKWGTKEWEDEIASCYLNNLKKSSKISEAFDAKFIAFFQPTVFFKKNLTAEEFKWSGPQAADYLYMRDKIQIGIDTYRKEKKMNFVDVSKIFAETRESVFTDDIHITHEANIAVAAEIYRHIVLLIRKDRQ